MRRQGLAGLRDDAPSHRSATMRHCCGGRRRVRRARAGFEIDYSERSSRVAISRAAGPDGARNTSVTTSKHAAAPPERRTRPGCWWAAAKPGRASRRRAQPPISHHAPLLWRAPEGPEGTGGLRDDAPSHAQRHKRRRCGGRRRVRRARAGFEIDRSERSSRAAISRAAGPDGARNTSGTTSTQQPRNANARQPVRAAARSRN